MSFIEALTSNSNLIIFSIIILAYSVYKRYLSYAIVPMKGDYNTKKKRVGKTVPPYPNGWYIACKGDLVPKNGTRAIDIAGQNIVVARDKEGKAHALYAYCTHMGAHLGVGGQVVSGGCLQCPFHGWLYNLETGQLVDHDKRPLSLKSFEYGDDFASGESRTPSWKQQKSVPTLRKYHTRELNTFIYVWIHSDPKVEPYFDMIDGTNFCKNYGNRGHTVHDIKCVMQDIPENGADSFHFKYVHRYLIGRFKMMEVTWKPKWMRGDDPNIAEIFEHESKSVRAFKQKIYNDLVKPLPNKQYYSCGTVDNYVHLPLLGPTFFFNITIVQMGPALVNIFLKTHFFQVVFFQYIQPQGKVQQRIYHEMFCSSWIPHWLCWILLYAEGMQVYYDMLIWDSKRFGHKIYLKDHEGDRFIKNWRQWFSQHYDGCQSQLEQGSLDW